MPPLNNNRHNQGQAAWKRGHLAEWGAKWWLRLKGYHIEAQRYKVPVGEIDIVARKGKTLAFIEVKYRPDYEAAAYAITFAQQQRIIKAAQWYLGQTPWTQDVRFDAILCGRRFGIRHLKHIWTLQE